MRDAGMLLDSQDIAEAIAVPVSKMDRLAVPLQVVDLAVRLPVRKVLGVLEQLDFATRPDPDVVVVAAAVHVAVSDAVAFEAHATLVPGSLEVGQVLKGGLPSSCHSLCLCS